MRRILLLVPVALVLLAADICPEPEDVNKADLKKLQGNWELKKATQKGKEDRDLDGMTMVIVTHEMAFARAVADRVNFVDRGKIIEEGSPDAVFDHPQHERTMAFLARIMR